MRKEEIRNNPWKIFLTIQRKNPNVRLIEIELKDEDEDLLLTARGLSRGRAEGDQLKDFEPYVKRFHKYNERTRYSFNSLILSSRRIRVFFAGETTPKIFDNYEEFLNKITKD